MTDFLIVGCGYLGSRLAALLRRESPSASIAATTRTEAGRERIGGLDLQAIVADVSDRGSLDALPLAKTIFYCVGFDRSAGKSIRDVYVEGPRNTVDRLVKSGWKGRLAYASSTGVYGQDQGEWVDEESVAEPRSASGQACLDAENLIRDGAKAGGFSAVSVRFSGLYGPGRVVRRVAIESGQPIAGDPERWLNLIHIEDAAALFLAAAKAQGGEVLFLASDDRPVRRGEYYRLVAECLKAPEPKFQPPATGSPEAAREESNKRVRNTKIRETLGVELRFPEIATGVPDALKVSE